MISPTGKGIRSDSMGQGHWLAKRSGRVHLGVDFMSDVGQEVFAPFDMTIKRVARPYGKSYLSGIKFQTNTSIGKMFYFEPDMTLINKEVAQGQIIGVAQDLSHLYGPRMTSHIHFQFDSFNPMVFIQVENHFRRTSE